MVERRIQHIETRHCSVSVIPISTLTKLVCFYFFSYYLLSLVCWEISYVPEAYSEVVARNTPCSRKRVSQLGRDANDRFHVIVNFISLSITPALVRRLCWMVWQVIGDGGLYVLITKRLWLFNVSLSEKITIYTCILFSILSVIWCPMHPCTRLLAMLEYSRNPASTWTFFSSRQVCIFSTRSGIRKSGLLI